MHFFFTPFKSFACFVAADVKNKIKHTQKTYPLIIAATGTFYESLPGEFNGRPITARFDEVK